MFTPGLIDTWPHRSQESEDDPALLFAHIKQLLLEAFCDNTAGMCEGLEGQARKNGGGRTEGRMDRYKD